MRRSLREIRLGTDKVELSNVASNGSYSTNRNPLASSSVGSFTTEELYRPLKVFTQKYPLPPLEIKVEQNSAYYGDGEEVNGISILLFHIRLRLVKVIVYPNMPRPNQSSGPFKAREGAHAASRTLAFAGSGSYGFSSESIASAHLSSHSTRAF